MSSETCGDSGKLRFHTWKMGLRERIAERMKVVGLTQGKLALALGVTRASVSQWLSDEDPTTPRPERLEALAAALKTDVHWLTTGSHAQAELTAVQHRAAAIAAALKPDDLETWLRWGEGQVNTYKLSPPDPEPAAASPLPVRRHTLP